MYYPCNFCCFLQCSVCVPSFSSSKQRYPGTCTFTSSFFYAKKRFHFRLVELAYCLIRKNVQAICEHVHRLVQRHAWAKIQRQQLFAKRGKLAYGSNSKSRMAVPLVYFMAARKLAKSKKNREEEETQPLLYLFLDPQQYTDEIRGPLDLSLGYFM